MVTVSFSVLWMALTLLHSAQSVKARRSSLGSVVILSYLRSNRLSDPLCDLGLCEPTHAHEHQTHRHAEKHRRQRPRPLLVKKANSRNRDEKTADTTEQQSAKISPRCRALFFLLWSMALHARVRTPELHLASTSDHSFHGCHQNSLISRCHNLSPYRPQE
jgi:hypothetical protein